MVILVGEKKILATFHYLKTLSRYDNTSLIAIRKKCAHDLNCFFTGIMENKGWKVWPTTIASSFDKKTVLGCTLDTVHSNLKKGFAVSIEAV